MSENVPAAAPADGNKTKAKRYGLRLDLGGAPKVAHQVPGVPGLYPPDRATPVGEAGELDMDRARALSEDPGTHLKLVTIPAGAVEELADAARADLEAARGGIASAARHADGAESIQVANEVTAVRSAGRA